MPEPDLSEFVALSKPARLRCSVGLAFKQLKPADRAKLQAALDESRDTIKHSAISTWLAARNIKIGGGTIARHRSKECSCDD
jgi:hypothetical protein